MKYTLIAAALLGATAALPQQRAASAPPPGNPNTRILNFESFQDGANFGHQLFQEDGTTSGQKYGPDGLLYGFYSYVQQDGNRVKVYWRAGAGVGYEVLGVEGLVEENLGSLKAAHPRPEFNPAPAQTQQQQQPRRPRPARVQNPNTFIPSAPTPPPRTRATPPPPQPKPAATLPPRHPIPVVPQGSTTPAPLRFDYPATLNLERTNTGFFSSLVAS